MEGEGGWVALHTLLYLTYTPVTELTSKRVATCMRAGGRMNRKRNEALFLYEMPHVFVQKNLS